MPISSPVDLFTNELRDIYSAEKQLSRALPRLSKVVQSETLRNKLDERLKEGERLLEAIDRAFDEMEVSKGRKRNEAIEGLIEEANHKREEIESDELLDAALIGAVQKVEHYCIAAWGTAAAFGRALGHDTAVEAFEQALETGKRFDEEMTELAENEVNPAMLSSEDGEEGEEGEDRPPGGKKSGRKSGSGHRRSG